MSKKKYKIEIPTGAEKVLLHTCCAPCASAIVEWMTNNEVKPILYYSNSNIYPREEYEKRKRECIRMADELGIEFAEGHYDHEDWREKIKGLEKEPERGKRCQECFRIRLEDALDYADKHDIRQVTTALASSRWKSLEQVGQAGCAAAEGHNADYWDQNWRKGGLQDRRNALTKEFNFYNQQYCGCEFSLAERKKYEAAKLKEEHKEADVNQDV